MPGHVHYRLAEILQLVMFRLCVVVIYLAELEFCASGLIRISARPKQLNEGKVMIISVFREARLYLRVPMYIVKSLLTYPIDQLLNSVFAKYGDFSVSRGSCKCTSAF